MRCPTCGSADVDREDSCLVIDGKEIPEAEYLCNDCGTHFLWRRNGLVILYSPRRDNGVPQEILGQCLDGMLPIEALNRGWHLTWWAPEISDPVVLGRRATGNE